MSVSQSSVMCGAVWNHHDDSSNSLFKQLPAGLLVEKILVHLNSITHPELVYGICRQIQTNEEYKNKEAASTVNSIVKMIARQYSKFLLNGINHVASLGSEVYFDYGQRNDLESLDCKLVRVKCRQLCRENEENKALFTMAQCTAEGEEESIHAIISYLIKLQLNAQVLELKKKSATIFDENDNKMILYSKQVNLITEIVSRMIDAEFKGMSIRPTADSVASALNILIQRCNEGVTEIEKEEITLIARDPQFEAVILLIMKVCNERIRKNDQLYKKLEIYTS